MGNEVWKDIVGYEGMYKISSCGRVLAAGRIRSNFNKFYKEHFLTIQTDKGGYHRVTLYKDGKPRFIPVHRLMAVAFIPNPENKPQVDHINGIRTDNRVENLRWTTNKENVGNSNTLIHKTALMQGGRNPMAIPVVSVDITTGEVRYFGAASEALPELGIKGRNSTFIGLCCKGKKGSYKGRRWYYASEYTSQMMK